MKIIASSVILVIALSLAIWKFSSPEPPAQTGAKESKLPRPGSTSQQSHSSGSGSSQEPNRTHGTDSNNAEANAATKAATIEKIHEASTTYDAAYLPVIKPYLTNSDPEIRENAVNAMIVLGDASAGKMLREAAMQMKTAEDVKIMLEAAEYVELPSADLKKFMKKKPADGEAQPHEPRKPRLDRRSLERSKPNSENQSPQTPSE